VSIWQGSPGRFAYLTHHFMCVPGTIGNICGIIAGFSLIGICELLFFLAKQLWQACRAELRADLAHIHVQIRTQVAEPEAERPMKLFILP